MPQTGMPVLRDGQLGLTGQSPITVDSQAWFAWLAQATRFCYQPTSSTFRLTLRKEKRRHGYYWYAYLKSDGKLHNAYVGRTEALTSQKLQQVFTQLMLKVGWQRQGVRDDHPSAYF